MGDFYQGSNAWLIIPIGIAAALVLGSVPVEILLPLLIFLLLGVFIYTA